MSDKPTSERLLPYAHGIIELDGAPEVPIAVNLGERALALDGIMTYLNKASQVRGSATVLGHGGGKFSERYGRRAGEVQRGAERNRDELLASFRQGIRVLIAEDALRANGMDEGDIDLERVTMQSGLNREFGVGKADAKKRAVVVRAAKKAGDIK